MPRSIEKAGLPRDRVLTDGELEAAIRERGDTVETFYYGHDYAAASLVRSSRSPTAQHIALDREEERLRALMRQEGWFGPGVSAGLISIARGRQLTRKSRWRRATRSCGMNSSHGEFFSDPAYADYVATFWLNGPDRAERDGFRSFLARRITT